MANAVPWKAILMAAESALSIHPIWPKAPLRRKPSFRRIGFLPRILDVRDGVELDVGDLAVHHLAAANIDVLDDVARLRIDRDRPARAVGVLPIRQDLHRL